MTPKHCVAGSRSDRMVESHPPVGGAQGAASPDCWFADTRVPATSAPRSTGSGLSLMVVCGFRGY